MKRNSLISKFINLFFKKEKYTWNNTKPFIPPVNKGHVIKVYDGDTITIATTLKFKKSSFKSIKENYRFSVRLAGLDCAEIKTNNENEKKVAKYVKYKLTELLLDKKVYLEDVKLDKYGRLLANVKLDNIDINKWLLDNKYAVKYDGNKKEEIDWIKFIDLEDNVIEQFNATFEESLKPKINTDNNDKKDNTDNTPNNDKKDNTDRTDNTANV